MKKKKNGKYLRFYNKYIDTGEIPTYGLCRCFETPCGKDDKRLLLFEPTIQDEKELKSEGLSCGYWACGLVTSFFNMPERRSGFTPLRQTIVLFLACINEEL